MNPTNNEYNPADDENQGVITKMVQGEEANTGVSQVDRMSPVTAQGPESQKAEVNDSDTEANGMNDDLLAEEAVEAGDINEETEADE